MGGSEDVFCGGLAGEDVSEGMSSATPKVTVGIPFYNASATLADAIRSVFAQTFQDWELILVDDGSRDGSLDIARRVLDPRVSVISDGLNSHLALRLNQIASLARAPLIARMDADDMMHPERLKCQVEFLEKNPEVDVVGSAAYALDLHDHVEGIISQGSPDLSPTRLLLHSLLIHPSTLMRREWAFSFPYDDTCERAQDYELWCRAFSRSKFAQVPEPLLFYRAETTFSFPKYSRSAKTERFVIRNYGPVLVGRMMTRLIMVRSILKTFIYATASPLGLNKVLLSFRRNGVAPQAKRASKSILDRIKSCPVPGL